MRALPETSPGKTSLRRAITSTATNTSGVSGGETAGVGRRANDGPRLLQCQGTQAEATPTSRLVPFRTKGTVHLRYSLGWGSDAAALISWTAPEIRLVALASSAALVALWS